MADNTIKLYPTAAENYAYNEAIADAANRCVEQATRIVRGKARSHQVDRYTAGILRLLAQDILNLKKIQD